MYIKIEIYILEVIESQQFSKNCFKIVSKIRQSTEKRPSCRHPEFNLYDFPCHGPVTKIVHDMTSHLAVNVTALYLKFTLSSF